MRCKLCYEDINEKGQDDISPISDYPICEDCKEDIMCAECCEGNYGGNLYYVAEFDKILCRYCLIKEAEENDYIHSVTHYYTQDYNEICNDCDTEPVIQYLDEYGLGIQEIKEC